MERAPETRLRWVKVKKPDRLYMSRKFIVKFTFTKVFRKVRSSPKKKGYVDVIKLL